MFQFLLVASLLRFKFHQFALSVDQSSLFILEGECLVIKDSVEIINASKCLGNVIFNSSDLGCILNTLFSLGLNLSTQLVNFDGIISVSFSELLKVIIQLFLLII
jgi:hypothetical protein